MAWSKSMCKQYKAASCNTWSRLLCNPTRVCTPTLESKASRSPSYHIHRPQTPPPPTTKMYWSAIQSVLFDNSAAIWEMLWVSKHPAIGTDTASRSNEGITASNSVVLLYNYSFFFKSFSYFFSTNMLSTRSWTGLAPWAPRLRWTRGEFVCFTFSRAFMHLCVSLCKCYSWGWNGTRQPEIKAPCKKSIEKCHLSRKCHTWGSIINVDFSKWRCNYIHNRFNSSR